VKISGSEDLSYTYPAPAGDGTVGNTVTVLCSIAGFQNTVEDDASDSTDYFTPSIAVQKTGNTVSKVGDDVNYTFTLSNNSSANTPDMECEAVDSLLGSIFADVLPPGDTVINRSRTVLPEDPDPLGNTVTLTCSPVGFQNVFDDSDSHEVDLIHPSFSVAKTCDAEPIDFDQDASFTVTIANTGDVELNITADDGIGSFTLGAGNSQNFNVLVPGPHTPGGTADNTVTASWTLPEAYGMDNTGSASASDSCDVLDVQYHTAYGQGDDVTNTCFDELGADNWGWVNGDGIYSILPGSTHVWPVWAGAAQCDTSKGTYVGTVEVEYDGTDVFVTWNIDSPHILGDTHVYAGLDMVPPGGFAPGQYEIYGPFNNETIYIIVHAIVGVAQ